MGLMWGSQFRSAVDGAIEGFGLGAADQAGAGGWWFWYYRDVASEEALR